MHGTETLPRAEEDPSSFTESLTAAHLGSDSKLGRLLEDCRQYLEAIAERELDPDLRTKASRSDLVQDCFLEAHATFTSFRGTTRNELLAWLRMILLNNLANLRRNFRDVQKRDIRREQSLDGPPGVEGLGAFVPDSALSPSSEASLREQEERLQQALGQLPPDYRDVIVLYHREGLSIDRVAERLDRSVAAVRKLWARAVQRLAEVVGQSEGERDRLRGPDRPGPPGPP